MESSPQTAHTPRPDAIVVLGPTASGKTAFGVRLARKLGGEILSADSRQVYRGLNIGAGKDLESYRIDGESIPYHLIDIADLSQEFSVFEYQKAFFDVYRDVRRRGKLPIVVAGTGLYLEAVLKNYELPEVPKDPDLRQELDALSQTELESRLRALRPSLHNTTDLSDRDRLVRAIEIALHRGSETDDMPDIDAYVVGLRWPRAELHRRIEARLRERLDHGMVEEVERLLQDGVSRERLRSLGLEYRYCVDFIEGAIKNRNDLFQKLRGAIKNFAKRQLTWFRRMERRGIAIDWFSDPESETSIRRVCDTFTRTPGR